MKVKQVPLGSLEPAEYEMLRAALAYASDYCECEANGEVPGEKRQLWSDRASEFRALLARFGKRGRK